MKSCPQCGEPLTGDARFCGGCGAALSSTEKDSQHPISGAPSPADAFSGREIAGRYRILTQLGQGGMGAVFRAEQISLKRLVALKLLRPELSQEPGLVRRFNAEAELAAKLSHPNTVTLFDFGQDHDGTLFIAMEFVDGQSLRNVMAREGPLPAARALAIAKQICASLTDAHARAIIHRDLKPDNVMLTTRGRERDVVRVLDFGIAKLRDERGDATAMQMTRAGDLLGTPQYMAPEQIRGETVDGRTDVYALGAMLYEMITGRLPFEAPTVMAILGKHLTEMPVSPASRRPDLAIPAALDQLIMESLQKSPATRPSSMEIFGERVGTLLQQIRSTATTSSGSPSSPSLEPRFTTRPPGVPLTAPPLGNAPVVPLATPVPPPMAAGAPAQTGPGPFAYPTGGASPAASTGRSGSTALIIGVLAVLAVGGAVVALVLATRGGSSESSTTETPTGPAEIPTGPAEIPTGPEPPAETTVEGTRWMDPTAQFGMILPPGFGLNLSPDPRVAAFEGKHGGQASYLMISGESAMGQQITAELLSEAIDNIMLTSGGSLLQKGTRTIRGVSYANAIFDVPQRGLRCECVLFPRGEMVVIAMFGTPVDHFADTGPARDELFQYRILLP